MSSVQEIKTIRKLPLGQVSDSVRPFARRAWRLARRCLLYLTLPIVTAYFLPKLFALYVVCGLLDVLRTRPWNRETLVRYFMGRGYGTWLTSPFNLLMDVATIPYRNKGIYKLEDLPPSYQAEIAAVIAAAEESQLSRQLESRMTGCPLGMIFFKWYGRNQKASINVPAFDAPFKYIRTIGVSVFNKRKSTSTHFGPLRITLRVLYCLNDISDPGAYIQVSDQVHRWRNNKLFIFDDTLQHKSCNETDMIRYCLFVDILRPSHVPRLMRGIVGIFGAILLPIRREFYKTWQFIK